MRSRKKIPAFLSALASLLIFVAPPHAAAIGNNDSFETKSVHAFLLYCLPALTAGESVASVAEAQKLPEQPSTAEAAFLSGKPGKVFGIPEVGGDIVLTAPNIPLCSVLMLKLDATKFIKEIDFWFDPNNTPFRLDENKTLDNGEIHRKYKAKVHDKNILLLVNVRPQPAADGGIQAMITAGIASD